MRNLYVWRASNFLLRAPLTFLLLSEVHRLIRNRVLRVVLRPGWPGAKVSRDVSRWGRRVGGNLFLRRVTNHCQALMKLPKFSLAGLAFLIVPCCSGVRGRQTLQFMATNGVFRRNLLDYRLRHAAGRAWVPVQSCVIILVIFQD